MILFDVDIPLSELVKRIDLISASLVTIGFVFIEFVLGQGEIAPDDWKTPCKNVAKLYRSWANRYHRVPYPPGYDTCTIPDLGVKVEPNH